MAYEQKENSGSMFRNEKKETKKHPDYTGSAKIGGVEYWMSSWINESANGTKYMAFKFKVKDDFHNAEPVETKTNEEGDDLPF